MSEHTNPAGDDQPPTDPVARVLYEWDEDAEFAMWDPATFAHCRSQLRAALAARPSAPTVTTERNRWRNNDCPCPGCRVARFDLSRHVEVTP